MMKKESLLNEFTNKKKIFYIKDGVSLTSLLIWINTQKWHHQTAQ
jgi:hypothetical protein